MSDIHSQILRTAGLEMAGLFWIAAELAILFLVLGARRHLHTRPLPPRLQWQALDQRRARIWCYGFLAFAAAVLGRHAVHALAPVPPDILPVLISRGRAHLAVWSLFITAWVALELAIVYHGFRGYTALKALLGPAQLRLPRPSAAMLCLLPALLLATAASAQTLLVQARAANQLYYNATYLYLRLAGVVWILAEWMAAVILWRAVAMVAAAAKRGDAPHA